NFFSSNKKLKSTELTLDFFKFSDKKQGIQIFGIQNIMVLIIKLSFLYLKNFIFSRNLQMHYS
ncbi:hypothetical protein BpHYR1_000874, partial [Brachionus plicatilis]